MEGGRTTFRKPSKAGGVRRGLGGGPHLDETIPPCGKKQKKGQGGGPDECLTKSRTRTKNKKKGDGTRKYKIPKTLNISPETTQT